MYKYTVIIISCFLFIFTAQAEVIKDIKIELDWQHELPIERVSKEDQREIDKIVNNL